jgi:hypothetical protein
MRILGVTPAYVASIRAAGQQFRTRPYRDRQAAEGAALPADRVIVRGNQVIRRPSTAAELRADAIMFAEETRVEAAERIQEEPTAAREAAEAREEQAERAREAPERVRAAM